MNIQSAQIPIRTALYYVAAGLLWIITSDEAVRIISGQGFNVHIIQTYKGAAFVIITGLFMYFLLKRGFHRIVAERASRIEAEEALHAKQNDSRSTLDTLKEGCQIIGFDWRYIYLNYTAAVHNRRPNNELIGREYTAVWPGIEQDPFFASLKQCMELRTPAHKEQAFTYPDGSTAWFDLSILPVPEGIFILSIDVTERRQAEARVASLSRLNSVLTNINQLIVRTKEIDAVLKEACTICVRNGKFVMAWIGLRNSATNTLDVIASAGNAQDYLDKINIDFNDPLYSSGPVGTAVITGKHTLTRDISADPMMAPWRSDALRLGYNSAAAFPLKINGAVVGALTLYSEEKDFFTEEELDLLDELAMDISFAMEVNINEQEKKKVQDALQETETIFSQFMEHSPVHIFFKDDQMRSLRLSKNYETMLGKPISELLGKTMDELFPSELARTMIADDKHILKKGKRVDIEEELNGRIYHTIKFPIIYKGAARFLAGFTIDITEQKRREDQLNESERLLRESQQVSRIGSYTLDIRTGTWKGSPTLLELFGFDPAPLIDELIGIAQENEYSLEDWLSVVHPDDRTMMHDYFFSTVVEEKNTFDKEYRIISRNTQTERWVHGIGQLEFDSSGQSLRMIGTIQDITTWKELELKISENEERYRLLVELSNDAIFINSANSIVYINPAGVTLFGAQSPEQIIGRSPFEVFHPDFHPIIKERIQTMLENTSSVSSIEEKIIRLDGTVVDVDVSASAFKYRGEVAIQAVLRDITEQKKMRQLVIDNEERYRLLFENSGEAILLTKANGEILSANPAACAMFGKTEAEICAGGREGIIDLSDPRVSEGLAERNRTGRFRGEINMKRSDGSIFPALISTVMFVNSKGDWKTTIAISDLSERKRVENILRESEERLRLSLEATQQGLYDLNVQTGDAIVSNEYATMLGFDPATFKETNAYWTERLHPDDVAHTSQAYADYVAGKLNEYRVEFRQRTAGGAYKWILSIGKIIEYTPDGKPLRMLGTHTDIDEMKKAEEQMLLQTAALDSAANGIVITDLRGTIVWCNKAFTEMTGYTKEEAIGASPNILKSGQQPPELYEHLWKTITSGKTWRGSIINKRKDGTLYDDEMTITPVRNATNAITHFVAVKQDVTERNKTIRTLEEQAMLLDEAHDAIILRDLNYIVEYWNKGAERLFGWTTHEALGRDLRTLIFSDSFDNTNRIQKLMNDGNYVGEVQYCTKDRRNVTVDIRMNVINDERGEPRSVLSISNDITDKKLVEAQLLRTQRMGSLGTLAGGIAHDLNNVMAPIMLATELLKKTSTDSTSQKILESVENSARRGSDIVKQILTFARGVDTQKVFLQPRHLIKEIVGIFKETFPRSITITTDIPNSTWMIMGDPTHFHQLIMNLGVNARDAMPEGGTLTISATNETIDEQYVRMNPDAKTGRFVRFSVRDTGTGISSVVLDKIFEPFFTTKEVGKGTGLGLSTVYTIVKSHGGFITVQSAVDQGTTMNVFLPAAEGTAVPADEKGTGPDLKGNGELILVVDDEQSIRDVMRQTLEAYSYTVITATDGADALGKFAEHRGRIALVLTDIMMPVMDGAKLITTLRKIDPAVKIIASSGLIETMKFTADGELRVNAYIDKPYTAETLMSTVVRVIKGT